MKSLIVLLNIIAAIILSSCKDLSTGPSPSTGFSVKVTVKNQGGAPVSGMRPTTPGQIPNPAHRDWPVKAVGNSKAAPSQFHPRGGAFIISNTI